MFTGIVTDIGRVRAIAPAGDTVVEIGTAYAVDSIALGASIACSGVCLTVIETGVDSFKVSVSAETFDRTTLGAWQVGSRVNLERSLKVGDELGGHIVSGHVDGVAEIIDRQTDGDSIRFRLQPPVDLSRFIAEKGSVALNGASITVNEVGDTWFDVNIIPHTQAETTFGENKIGDKLNLEIDVLARYVGRLAELS